MNEPAAERAETDVAGPGVRRGGQRSAASRIRAPAEQAARALFQRTSLETLERPAVGVDPRLAITLSELRRQVALQAGQLERAMEEIQTLHRRLEASRSRATAAEQAVARERALRGRQASESARRLAEHEQAIAQLSARLRSQRAVVSFRPGARPEPLERRTAARERLDERVADVVATARRAIVEVRAELARGDRRIADLQSSLIRERRRRVEAERRLADAPVDRPRIVERRRYPTIDAASGAADRLSPGPPGSLSSGLAGPSKAADVASACRRLEQELAARDALEVQAARLIGRVHRELRPAG